MNNAPSNREQAAAQREHIIEAAAAALSEHFDSVRIFVSVHVSECEQTTQDERETESYSVGAGNYHAQMNQVREWLLYKDMQVRAFYQRQCKAGLAGDGE